MSVYHFEMEMCCSMQVRSLIHELELCKQVGDITGRVVHPRYPAAPRDDTLFDSMNLYAKLADDGKVEFPLYPVVNGSLIKATVETPVYNINKIGAKALYEKFLEYNDIVLENYGEDIRRLENGETVTNLTVREEDLERYLR